MTISLSAHANLYGLRTVLNYQLSTTALLFLAYILGPFIVITKSLFVILIIIVSILFIPYMLFVLSNARKYGWILFFCIIVLIPLLCTFVFLNSSSNLYYAILLILFALFFFYCFLLRLAVNDWVKGNNRKTQRLQERLEDELNGNIF